MIGREYYASNGLAKKIREKPSIAGTEQIVRNVDRVGESTSCEEPLPLQCMKLHDHEKGKKCDTFLAFLFTYLGV